MPDGMDEKQFRSCSRTSDDRKIVGLTCILWMKLGPNQGEKEEEGRHERARYGLSYTYPWTIFLKHIFRRRERHQGSNFCTLPFFPPYSFMIHFVCRPQPTFFQPFAWRENRRDKRTIHALFPLFVNRSYNYRKKCVSITLLLLFLCDGGGPNVVGAKGGNWQGIVSAFQKHTTLQPRQRFPWQKAP